MSATMVAKKPDLDLHPLNNKHTQGMGGIGCGRNGGVLMELVPRGQDVVRARIHVKKDVLGNQERLFALDKAEQEPDADRERAMLQKEAVQGEEHSVRAKGVYALRNGYSTRREYGTEHMRGGSLLPVVMTSAECRGRVPNNCALRACTVGD